MMKCTDKPLAKPRGLKNIELLAPAGDWACAEAAVAQGADAIYFGLQSGFNARARAANFALDDLPRLLAFLHGQGVRGYLTLNTLVMPSEWTVVETLARQVAEAGIDAVLVQDIGLACLLRRLAPDLTLHASTQMSLSSAECIAAARSLGIERVVLPRELSIKEIAQIAQDTDLDLEAFVHGALCIAYSGQCQASQAMGGRSANRGECAQACRLPYSMLCDGKPIDLGDKKYLFSPHDLAAYSLLPDLLAAGVTSFKIEGRMKTPDYVATVTRNYRAALDAAVAGNASPLVDDDIREMELCFSRGFSPGWLAGANHQQLVDGRDSSNRGLLLGQVRSIHRDRIRVELAGPVRRGDGIVFEGDRAAGEEQGGRVYEIFLAGKPCREALLGEVELAFEHGKIDTRRLRPGLRVWKTDDPQLVKRLRAKRDAMRRRLALSISVEAAVGRPLTVRAKAGSAAVELASESPLEEAQKHPLSQGLLEEQFGRLGETPFHLSELTARIDGRPMAPLSVLGQLRRAMIEQLEAQLSRPRGHAIADRAALASLRGELRGRAEPPKDLQWHVLCRFQPQLEAVLADGAESVLADFNNPRDYGLAVVAARRRGASITLATPRIQKPGELGFFRQLLKHHPDAVLVRNLAGLRFFVEHGIPAIADFSLNVTNELSLGWLLAEGAVRATAAYDLSPEELLQLAAAAPPGTLEVVVRQHSPLFHSEHCVFCATLSQGTDYTNCGRPCDRHDVRLIDRKGVAHRLLADAGCRNTLFHAEPQDEWDRLADLTARSLRHARIELLDEPALPAACRERMRSR